MAWGAGLAKPCSPFWTMAWGGGSVKMLKQQPPGCWTTGKQLVPILSNNQKGAPTAAAACAWRSILHCYGFLAACVVHAFHAHIHVPACKHELLYARSLIVCANTFGD